MTLRRDGEALDGEVPLIVFAGRKTFPFGTESNHFVGDPFAFGFSRVARDIGANEWLHPQSRYSWSTILIPFGSYLSSSLQSTSERFVCWEAADGLEAVHKAEELQPDLILLDIGLPKLNGIGAAQQIAKVSPASKILFVSQESSADVVREAFRVGAAGYIVKNDVARELSTAVKAVLGGSRFVASRFDGHEFTGASDVRVSDSALKKRESARRHEAQFYS